MKGFMVEHYKKQELKIMSLIFIIALIPRLVFTFLFDITPYVAWTDMDYSHYQAVCMTQGILKGGCYAPLLYPLFLSLIYRIFSVNYLLVGIIQSIISSFSCILVYQIAKMSLNKTVGILSAIICALYFPFIFYSAPLYAENQYMFLMLLSLYFLLLFYYQRKMRFLVLTAIGAGLTMMTKSAMTAILTGMILWVVVSFKDNIRALVKYSLIFLIVFAITISPGIIRNYLILNRFILTSAKSAAFLAASTGKIKRVGVYYNEKYNLNKPLNARNWKWLYFDKGLNTLIDYYKKATKEYLKTDPLILLKLIPRNIWGQFFRNHYDVYTFDYPVVYYLFRIYQFLFSVLLLPVFLISFFILPRDKKRKLSLLYFVTISNTIFYIILWGHPRFRAPSDKFFIIIFAATCIELMINYKQRRKDKYLTASKE